MLKFIKFNLLSNNLTILLTFLGLFSVMNCAHPHLGYRAKYTSRLEIIRKSQIRLQEIESQNFARRFELLLQQIRYYLGTPYKFGGDTRQGMDCSGFVSVVYRKSFNKELPHNANKIFEISQKISLNEIALGDLVFFGNRHINHVGIYLHNNYFAHASRSYGVIISDLNDKYYQSKFVAAGRVVDFYADVFDEKQLCSIRFNFSLQNPNAILIPSL